MLPQPGHRDDSGTPVHHRPRERGDRDPVKGDAPVSHGEHASTGRPRPRRTNTSLAATSAAGAASAHARCHAQLMNGDGDSARSSTPSHAAGPSASAGQWCARHVGVRSGARARHNDRAVGRDRLGRQRQTFHSHNSSNRAVSGDRSSQEARQLFPVASKPRQVAPTIARGRGVTLLREYSQPRPPRNARCAG